MAVALLLGVAGTAVRSDEAQAKPTDILSINPAVCVALTAGADWNVDMDADTDKDATDNYLAAVAACGDLHDPVDLAALAAVLDGDVDDPGTYADLAAAGADQLNENTGALWVLIFVTNDAVIALDADEGNWASSGNSLAACAGDADCDANGIKGDGVVVDMLLGAGVADLGDAQLVATQSGVDVFLDYVVVGDPDDLTLAVIGGDTIQEGLSASDCKKLDVSDFAAEIAAPEVTGLIATVTDEDGTELAGIQVAFDSDDTDVVNLNLATMVTLATDAGTLAPNLACGGDIGTATVTAEDSKGNDAEVDLTVIGAPDAMTLTASPAKITCNGVTSSTVSAALVDSEGNPVVDGTKVRFDVVALGVSDPITATTVDGAATSKITPLSLASAGVVVVVSVDSADLEASIRVDCEPAAPPVVPPVTPPVTPPRTGDGGYLD